MYPTNTRSKKNIFRENQQVTRR